MMCQMVFLFSYCGSLEEKAFAAGRIRETPPYGSFYSETKHGSHVRYELIGDVEVLTHPVPFADLGKLMSPKRSADNIQLSNDALSRLKELIMEKNTAPDCLKDVQIGKKAGEPLTEQHILQEITKPSSV